MVFTRPFCRQPTKESQIRTSNWRMLYERPWRDVPLEAEDRRCVVTSPLARTVSAVVRIAAVRRHQPFFNVVEDYTHQILSPKLPARHLRKGESRRSRRDQKRPPITQPRQHTGV